MDFENKAFLAPMSTFTNLAFRLLCQRHGAKGTVVPLVSAKAIVMRKKDDQADPHPDERFVGVQVFGNSSKDIGKAAEIISGKYDFIKFIDINCACPVKKVVRTGAGSALLRKPELAAELIKAAMGCGLPVTVKARKLKDQEKTVEFCRSCESAGASAIFFHGRTPEQGYSGKADWGIIKLLSEEIKIPIIGSGDVRSMGDGREKALGSGTSSFMIGRAAMSDPAVFSSGPSSTYEHKRSIFQEYIEICREFDCISLTDLKSKALQIFSNFDDSASIRRQIVFCKKEEELFKAVGIG